MFQFLYLFLTCSALFSPVLVAMPVDRPAVVDKIISKSLTTRFENKEELFKYLSKAIDWPWVLDYENTKSVYGNDNVYIRTLLNNFEEKNYLHSYKINLTTAQQKSQIDYLLYVVEKIDRQDNTKDYIGNLVEYLKIVIPNQGRFNFAQRLNLYTQYTQNGNNADWLNVLFFEEEKEKVILFTNKTKNK